MLYHCLSASVPFPRDNDVAVINAHLRDAPPSIRAVRPELPAELDRVIRKAMAKKPDDRYPTGRAFIAALKQALGRTPTETRPIPVSPMRRRLPFIVAGAAAILVVMGMAAASLGLLGGTPSPSPSPLAAGTGGLAATPTSTTFPSEAEQALMSRLPVSVRSDCRRIDPRVDGGFGFQQPDTSIECQVATTKGTIQLQIYQFPFDGTAQSEFFNASGRLELPGGDCATTPRATGKWTAADVPRGDLLCFQEEDPPRSWLIWTYRLERIFARASSAGLDSKAMYAWWLSVAPFID
jgi:serine/threonine protein kinase